MSAATAQREWRESVREKERDAHKADKPGDILQVVVIVVDVVVVVSIVLWSSFSSSCYVSADVYLE